MKLSEKFFQAAKRKEKTVEALPGVGDVIVKELSAGEVSDLREKIADISEEARGKAFVVGLIILSTYLGAERLFSDEDEARFADVGNGVVELLSAAAMEVNGYQAKN